MYILVYTCIIVVNTCISDHHISDTLIFVKSDMVWKSAYKVLTNLYYDRSLVKQCRHIFPKDENYERQIEILIDRLTNDVINPLIPGTIKTELARGRNNSGVIQKIDDIEEELNRIVLKHQKIQSQVYMVVATGKNRLATKTKPA